MSMSWYADLIMAQDGDVIIIPLALVRRLGLPAAAFLRQAAYLSAVVKSQGGWFFLKQQGSADNQSEYIFQRLGSWHASLGIGPDAQLVIREQLKKIGLLEESGNTVHGKLLYRVDPERYLKFLASCNRPADASQSGNPECANREPRLYKPKKSVCTIGKNRNDIYKDKEKEKEDLPRKLQRKTTTTTAPKVPSSSFFETIKTEPSLSALQPQIVNLLVKADISDLATAQDLVDELAGRIEAGQRGDKPKVGSPLDLLRTYITRNVEGRFDRVHCLSVQARRSRAQDELKAKNFDPIPQSPEVIQQHLKNMRSSLGRRG